MAQIDLDVLITYGAEIQKVKKGEFIFQEGTTPHYFFQVIDGTIKMITLNLDGKEFIQGVFNKGQSFGEPPLITGGVYPASAVALKNVVVVKLSLDKLKVLMTDNPDITIKLLECMAQRIQNKVSISRILNCHDPEEKIISFLDNYKHEINSSESIQIPFTRQQIADSTGLCVETVIRTLLKMSEKNIVEINNHKVFY